jgi:hypothetical protein
MVEAWNGALPQFFSLQESELRIMKLMLQAVDL